MRINRSQSRVQSLSWGQWGVRGLLVASLLALTWWAAWVFDPRNLGGQTFLFAVVVAAQALDLFAVLGFWHAIWPRGRPRPLFAPVRGRGSLLVLTRGEPVQVVEQTLQAALAVRRRHRVFLADPFERPELGWLAGWYGVRRLSPGMGELDGVAGARFLAVIEVGQVPRPEFLERLLPYFADRSLALVQARCSRGGRRRSGVRDAILRGEQALDRAGCLGSNYALRRSSLHSIGGFGPSATTPVGALRLAAALRADQWRTRYVSEQLTDTSGPSGPVSRLAEARRRWAAELAAGLRPGSRRRGLTPSRGFHAAWAAMRYPALVGLPVSAAAVAAYAALQPLPLSWASNLAVHLLPYLVLRATVRVVVAVRRPEALPALRPPAAARADLEGQEAELQDLLQLAPELQPELHMGWKVLSSPGREPMPLVSAVPEPAPAPGAPRSPEPASPEPAPQPEPGVTSVPAAAEALPPRDPTPGPRPRVLRPAVAMAAAWILTTGAIGAVAFAVIRSNPPPGPSHVHGSSAPPYSYYAPVQPPPGGIQPSR